MPNISCYCTTTGGDNVMCSTGSGYGTPNMQWFYLKSSKCCVGGSHEGGLHEMCNGNSCDWTINQSTCFENVTNPTGGDEEEALWGYQEPNLTVDGGSGNQTSTDMPDEAKLLEKSIELVPVKENKFVSYHTSSGEEWFGPTHIMPGGKIMAGTIDERLNKELTTSETIYLTPSGKQWCGSWHKSMLGTLMSGIARDKFGSGPDGKSEILIKRLIDWDTKNLDESVDSRWDTSGYKSCKTDEPKPSWDCTMGGCMLLPLWWPPGQFTGPNAYVDCTNACKSWMCKSFVLFPPWNFELCLCGQVQGTGASQTYPTSGLCWAAAQTKPCCTDDYNTYNCTINGCEVHTGPGVGTYNQVPYALYECQQECRAWGCFDVYNSSAYTETGYSYTNYSFSTPHMSAHTGYTPTVWTPTVDPNTTVIGESTDMCIHVFYDTTSMDAQLLENAELAITQWRDQEMMPGQLLEHWRGIFINTNVSQNSPVANGVGGTKIGIHTTGTLNDPNLNERWLLWPQYSMDFVETQSQNPMPCISDPQNNLTAPSIPQAYSQLSQMSCSCRNILVISLIDESDNIYNETINWQNPSSINQNFHGYQPLLYFDDDRLAFIDGHTGWTQNGGSLHHLVYPASEMNKWHNRMQGIQIFLATQGNRFDTANNGNILTYSPPHGNVTHINGNAIFGNPIQDNFTNTTGLYSPPEVWNFQNWIETSWYNSNPSVYGGNPFLDGDQYGNPYTPLEDYGTFGIYNRRGVNAFSVNTLGEDLTDFIQMNPITSTYNPIIWTSANTVTSTTVYWWTLTPFTVTAVTSTTTTTNWWSYDVCLSAETIPYIDYPYLSPPCQLPEHKMCERPGYDCGVDGCYEQWNGEFFDKHNCELACLSWSCVTRTGSLEPEQGWQMALGATPPISCQGTMEDLQGNTVSAYQPVTGNTYDFVTHCFGVYQPSTLYQPNAGVLLGGLWDNTGTSWVQGVTTTTTQNGLVVIDTGGGNCKTWHPDHPFVPGRITKVTSFILRDLNGNILYKHDGSMVNIWDIINELGYGQGFGWSSSVPYTGNVSPDWPTGMPSFVVGPGIPLDQLITYGNNATGDNGVKEFTVEVEVYGCPCEQDCFCELIPGIDTANTTTWGIMTPGAYNKCKDECCEKVKTWKCPDNPNYRDALCVGCPNGGGCYDPLDGSGIHTTQSLCEDVCAVSWDCYSATPISAVTIYSTNTTCEHVLEYLPFSGIPASYFQGKEPTSAGPNDCFSVAQDNFSGWTWGRNVGSLTTPTLEAFKFDYANTPLNNYLGGVSNAFEALIYIFDESKGYHNYKFNEIGFWSGHMWDEDSFNCEYPSPQGDKELGVIEALRTTEFTKMYCIDYEIRENQRPWVTTEAYTYLWSTGVLHPLAESVGGQMMVRGAAEVCNRQAGDHPLAWCQPVCEPLRTTYWGGLANNANYGTSPLSNYYFTSVKDLKDKIHWMYSQPAYTDTYNWTNLNLFPTTGPILGIYSGYFAGKSRNITNLQEGACTNLGKDLAKLYNPGPMSIQCTDPHDATITFSRPHPSNGLKNITTTPNGLQLKDFWSIGMFRNFDMPDTYSQPAVVYDYEWRFTPYNNYCEFERKGEMDCNQTAYKSWRYNSFMTLGGLPLNLMPWKPDAGVNYGGDNKYGLVGRTTVGIDTTGNLISTKYGYGNNLYCQCEMPCYCDILNGDQGDYEFENQCHNNCCPDYYYYICCQPDTNPAPTSIPPFQVSCLYSISNCQCPPGSHQVACPWIVNPVIDV